MNTKWLAAAAMAGALVLPIGCTQKQHNAAGNAANGAQPVTTSPRAAAVTSAATAGSTSASLPTGATLTSANRAAVTASSTTVDVVKALRPSVVRVRTEASQVGAFGAVQGASGTGTGVVLDTDGHVLTNNHVVTLGSNQPAQKITVDLSDGQSVSGTLVGREPTADLAVIKIDAKNLVPVKFADPKSIQVGEDVVAMGYALDLGSTPSVTKGVVSALDRQIDETLTGSARGQNSTSISIGGAIQTDTPINPGNSGGPLVDMTGAVVGINTAGIFSSNQQPVQGINFAVSVDTIQPVVKSLIDKGKVDRGYLGVLLQPITREIAAPQSLPVSDGIGVAQVTAGSAADKAGLKSGDIIVKAGDRDIHGAGDLSQVLIENGPGTKLHVEYYRGNNRQSTDVVLGSRPSP